MKLTPKWRDETFSYPLQIPLCHFPVNTPPLEATGILICITRDEFALAELHISGTVKYIDTRF